MSALLVGYDLNRPGQNYHELIKFLQSQQNWCHPLDSTWIVLTTKTPSQFVDEIKRFIDSTDEVMVMNVTNDDWATFGLSTQVTNWLQTHV
jgi:hypothetical protein